jgi:hypothetical protein
LAGYQLDDPGWIVVEHGLRGTGSQAVGDGKLHRREQNLATSKLCEVL